MHLASMWKTMIWVVVLMLTALILIACEPGDPGRSTGAYKIDVFQEMHYNQTYKSQEPPRILPPEDSIPISGGLSAMPESRADAANLTNPLESSGQVLSRAALTYNVNCASCHGDTAEGDGYVGLKFVEYGAPQPPAFSSSRIMDLQSGETYHSITQGYGYMPAFGKLLTDQDRWGLIRLIELQPDKRLALLKAPENQAPGGN